MSTRHDFLASRFNFTIYAENSSGSFSELVGGLTNVFAAHHAYDMMLIARNPPDRILLREGARVLRDEEAVGSFREWILEGQPSDWIERMRRNSSAPVMPSEP